MGHRRQPVAMWPPRNPPPTKPSRSDRQRPGGGAEVRAPIRRRRAHSHQPGLCSDKWGASCPDVWSRGPRASPRQRGSCLGRRRSDVVPGPTKPVQPLTPPRRGASPLACTYPPPTRNPPPTKPSRSDRQRPREGGNPPWRGGVPSPHVAVAQRPPAQQTRKGGPHARRWTQTRPCWRSCNVPPPGATPPPRLSAEDTPWANRPSKGPRPQSIKGESSNSLGKGALTRKQLLFYPPASFKNRQKNTKQSYKGRLIIRRSLLTEAAKLFNDATPQPSPTKPSR